MAKKQDERILQLQQRITEKKSQLSAAGKFEPSTNCSLPLDGTHYNLHTLNDAQSIMTVMIKVNMYRLSVKDLGLDYKHYGYTFDEWLTDLRVKLFIITYKQEIARLQKLEEELGRLLSSDKQIELKVSNIAAQI